MKVQWKPDDEQKILNRVFELRMLLFVAGYQTTPRTIAAVRLLARIGEKLLDRTPQEMIEIMKTGLSGKEDPLELKPELDFIMKDMEGTTHV